MYLYDTDGDGNVLRYNEENAYVMRDQSARTADETIDVVISDIVAVAQASGLLGTAIAATKLLHEAEKLWPGGNVDGWTSDPDASEKLQDILRQAEQLDGIQVDWDGDAGTVTVSLSDKWEVCPADEVPEYL